MADPTGSAIDSARRDRDRVRAVLVRGFEDCLRRWMVARFENDRDGSWNLGVQQRRLEDGSSPGARHLKVRATARARSGARASTRTDDDNRALRDEAIAHAAHGLAGGVRAVEADDDAWTLPVLRTVTPNAITLG